MPYDHVFTCLTCGSNMTLRTESATNPLSQRVGIHSSFAPANLDRDYYHGIQVRAGAGAAANHCHGRIQYQPDRMAYIAPPPPPVAVVHSALTWSHTYAHGAAHPEGVNTISAAFDPTNQHAKRGRNGHGLQMHDLHATLRASLHDVDQEEAWVVTNCAEVEAVDRLLKDGSAAAHIRVHSRDQHGVNKPPCANCSQWLVAVPDGSYRLR